MTAFTVVAFAAIATSAACPWLIGFLQRRSMVDRPGIRSSHEGSIPRGGGLALVFGVGVSLATHTSQWLDQRPILAVVIFGSGFATLGLIDDIRTLPASARLCTQSVLAWTFMVFVAPDANRSISVLAVVIGAFWIMGFVNAFNFMDGINGISSATTVVVGTSLAVVSFRWDAGVEIPALALVGAALGFAPFNAIRPRLFLGDVGSYLLGSMLALLAVAATIDGAPIVPVMLPFALYAADTSFTLISRARQRKRVLKSHREHVYQRLVHANGLSHLQATGVTSSLTIVLVAIAHLSPSGRAELHWLLGGIVLTALTVYIRLPTLIASLNRQRCLATTQRS